MLVAINDDMPFLFDSLIGELYAEGGRLRAAFHPIVRQGGSSTSVIVAVLDPISGDERLKALVDGARAVFAQVRVAVRDWKAMATKLEESIAGLKSRPPLNAGAELAESIAFLEWLGDNHFTFLGCRDYRFQREEGGRLEPLGATGLGVLAVEDTRVLRYGSDRGSLDAADPRLPDAARSADHHQVERTLARASPRAHGLCRREDFRRGRRALRRAPLCRPVHLERLQPPAAATFRCCGARCDNVMARAGLAAQQP